MREFKFRAWDKWDKRMKQPHEGDFIKWHAMSNWQQCLEVMQYTGLKDHNDTDIYEGDVVHFIYGERPTVSSFDGGHDVIDGWTKEEVLEVEFVRGSFMIGKHLMWNLEDFPFDYSLKVIGNIYQGHDLLDQN